MEHVTEFSTAGTGPTSGQRQSVVQQYARLPALIEPGTTGDAASVHRLAELLGSFEEPAVVNLHFVGVTGTQRWHLRLEPNRAAASEGAAGNAMLEIIMRPETWTEIAAGSLSPLLAFGSGRMRVRGDVRLAKRLLGHLATSPDAIVDVC